MAMTKMAKDKADQRDEVLQVEPQRPLEVNREYAEQLQRRAKRQAQVEEEEKLNRTHPLTSEGNLNWRVCYQPRYKGQDVHEWNRQQGRRRFTAAEERMAASAPRAIDVEVEWRLVHQEALESFLAHYPQFSTPVTETAIQEAQESFLAGYFGYLPLGFRDGKLVFRFFDRDTAMLFRLRQES